MQNLLDDLKQALEKDSTLLVEGQLNKALIEQKALALDKDFLKLILDSDSLKKHFFEDIDGTLVFDKVMFQQFIHNKSFLPDSYTTYKNKIGLTSNGDYLSKSGEVVLAWPHKDCVLEGGQDKEDAKRDEIFWNETLAPDDIDRLLAPKVFTNWKKYDKDGEQEVEEPSLNDNYLIKGNNLLALHSLADVYRGKVKLIYIDPPYNTGNDGFNYNDSFNHSTWLTFLKDRLTDSKNLLSKDGTIAISIDHNELGYLLVLLDEIFGKDNRKNIITVKRGSVTGAKVINPGVVNISEYVVLYSKNFNQWKPNRVYTAKERDERYNGFIVNYENGPEKWSYTTVLEAFSSEVGVIKSKLRKHFGKKYGERVDEFVYKNSEKVIQLATLDENSISKKAIEVKRESENNPDKVFILEREGHKPYYILNGKLILFAEDRMIEVDGKKTFSQPATDIWDDVLPNDLHNEGGVKLRKGKKPEKLLSRIVELCTDEEDLVVDFFAGSGTTGSVCKKMKRQFIIIEQLDYTEALPLKRLVNTIKGEQSGISKNFEWIGGGSFIYAELKKANQQWVEDIRDAKDEKALSDIWEKMKEKAFISYKVNPKDIDENAEEFGQLSLEDQKRFLIEVLDKNLLYVNYSEIDDADFEVSEEDKKLNDAFYGLKK